MKRILWRIARDASNGWTDASPFTLTTFEAKMFALFRDLRLLFKNFDVSDWLVVALVIALVLTLI